MGIKLNPLDIVRCYFPEGHPHGDPNKPSTQLHRVLVVRTTNDADGSQWALVVFGTGQYTADKNGPPCSASQIDIDPDSGTGLTTQTRFHFDKHVAMKVDDQWFPADPAELARGHVPQSAKANVLSLIDLRMPLQTTASPKLATPPPVSVEVKNKRFTMENLRPQPPSDA